MKTPLIPRNTLAVMSGLLFTFAVSLVGCDWSGFGPTLVGSGVSVTEEYPVEPFTKIEMSGALNVDVTVGEAAVDVDNAEEDAAAEETKDAAKNTALVTATGDDNVVELISAKVTDGTLYLKLDHEGRVQEEAPLVITVNADALTKTNVSGACTVNINGISGDDFDIGVSGASKLTLSGQCEQLQAEISGASTLEASSLQSNRAIVDVSGASNATVHATESIIGSASGASSIRYSGNPSKANVNTSGASSAGSI